MAYLIQTKTGVKGPFSDDQIQKLYDRGQLKREHNVTDEESGVRLSVASVLDAAAREVEVLSEDDVYEDASPFVEEEDPQNDIETEELAKRPTQRRTRSGQGRGRSSSGVGGARRSRRKSQNAFAAPETDGDYTSDVMEEDNGAELLFRCVSPMNKAVLWMRVIAVFTVVFSLLGLVSLIYGNWPALVMLIPLAIGVLLTNSASKIRKGMLRRHPKTIRDGLDNLRLAMMTWAIVLLIYLALVVVLFIMAYNRMLF